VYLYIAGETAATNRFSNLESGSGSFHFFGQEFLLMKELQSSKS